MILHPMAQDPAMLGHPKTSDIQYSVPHLDMSLSAAQAPGQLRVVYEAATLSSDTQPALVLTPMDMDVANTLAELHKSTIHAPPTTTQLHHPPSPCTTPLRVTEIQGSESPQLCSQTNRLMIITQDESGEIAIQKCDNVSLEKGEEKMLKKIAKTASIRPLKADKDAAFASLDQDILDNMVRYEGDEATKKITMRDLRHVIPLLIMRCYAISEEPYQRKVRGMWAEKPQNWPPNIPYCDPNNKKNMGKPKKSILLQMFIYLRNHYTTNYGEIIEKYKAKRATQNHRNQLKTAALSQAAPSPSMVAMDTVTTMMTVGSTVNGPSTALSSHHPTTFTAVHQLQNDQNSPSTPPAELTQDPSPTIMTTPLEQHWDPENDILRRIKIKITTLSNYVLLSENDKNMLNAIEDVLSKMFQVRSQDHAFFLDVAHQFEATIDLIRVTGTFPEKKKIHWEEFYQRHCPQDVAASEQVLDITEDTVACEPLGLGREEEVTTDYNNIIISTPNSKAPPNYLNTSDIELESTDSDSKLSPDYIDLDIDGTTTQNFGYSLKMNELIDMNNCGKGEQPDSFGALLTTSLEMTRCDYANSPDAQPPPAPVEPTIHPSNTSPFHDAHDEEVFPLSADYIDNDMMTDIYGDTLSTELQPATPSTNMVTTVVTTQSNTTELIQQEDQARHINARMTELKIRREDPDNGEKVKSMAQAFFNMKKRLGKTIAQSQRASAPAPVLNTAFNHVIPVVVEDMENEMVVEHQPNAKKRRVLKRPFPSSSLTWVAPD